MKNLFETIKEILKNVKEWILILLQIAFPVWVILALCELLFNMKLGIITRTLELLSIVGIKGNLLVIILAVIAVAWYSNKKK